MSSDILGSLHWLIRLILPAPCLAPVKIKSPQHSKYFALNEIYIFYIPCPSTAVLTSIRGVYATQEFDERVEKGDLIWPLLHFVVLSPDFLTRVCRKPRGVLGFHAGFNLWKYNFTRIPFNAFDRNNVCWILLRFAHANHSVRQLKQFFADIGLSDHQGE